MVSVGNLHNTRILRFLLVLIAVILTIFIYASYSTTTTLIPTHMHALVAPPPTPQQLTGAAARGQHQQQSEQVLLNSTGEFGLATGEELLPSSNIKSRQELHRKVPQHRLPTIDEDALLDGGAGGASPMAGSEQAPSINDELTEDQQYMQNIDAITGNINTNSNNNNNNNNSSSSSSDSSVKQTVASAAAVAASPQQQQQQQQQQQSPSDAEILMIPTSNLQKFIENADKILKNITSNSSSNLASSSALTAVAPLPGEQRTDKTNQPGLTEDLQINLLDSNNAAAPPQAASYAVMPVQQQDAEQELKEKAPPAPKPQVPLVRLPKTKSKPSAPVTPMDPSKGIATEKIYESGHLNEEIDVERICPANGLNTRLLVLITSAQTHADARMSIRQTWGHYGTRRDIGMAFVLGRGLNETVNQALSQENYMYGDLIRGNFIDSYNNLTLKTISSLEWADQHCHQAKYILKTDDDMFINVPKLLNFLKQLEKHKQKRVIFGRLAKKWKPIRNKKSKYYVSTNQFPAAVFPSFTTGPAYVITGDIVHDLYVRALKTVYLKLEDVFTTGIVAQSLGIERLHVNEFVNRRISFNPCNIRNAISVHMIKSNEQFDLWKKLLDQTTKYKNKLSNSTQFIVLDTFNTAKSQVNSYAVQELEQDAETLTLRRVRTTTVESISVPFKIFIAEEIYEKGHLSGNIDASRICPLNGLRTRLVMLITSALTNFEARMAIRQTWGKSIKYQDMSMAFVLGRGVNATVNQMLSVENNKYNDLIRGNFIDSYDNLTLKTISLLEWVDHNCHRVKFVLKMDDDVFINVPLLIKFLKRMETINSKRVIYGRVFSNHAPVHNKESKYYVRNEEYTKSTYPPFATGPAYVLTSDIVHELYMRALKTVYFKLEDVFITGIVAQSLGIERLHMIQFLNTRLSLGNMDLRTAISLHGIKPSEQSYLWEKLLDQNPEYT